eukprot:COSAG05_NODE_17834_length_318_cov_1.168950_2_plen_23_part_01
MFLQAPAPKHKCVYELSTTASTL